MKLKLLHGKRMKKNLKYVLLICAFTLSVSYANKIAVATKIKGLVEIMPAGKRDFIQVKTRNHFVGWR